MRRRQEHGEGTPAALFASDPNFSAVPFYDAAANRKPEPGPLVLPRRNAFGLFKLVEYSRLRLEWNSLAFILHPQMCHPRIIRGRLSAYSNCSARRRELD